MPMIKDSTSYTQQFAMRSQLKSPKASTVNMIKQFAYSCVCLQTLGQATVIAN